MPLKGCSKAHHAEVAAEDICATGNSLKSHVERKLLFPFNDIRAVPSKSLGGNQDAIKRAGMVLLIFVLAFCAPAKAEVSKKDFRQFCIEIQSKDAAQLVEQYIDLTKTLAEITIKACKDFLERQKGEITVTPNTKSH